MKHPFQLILVACISLSLISCEKEDFTESFALEATTSFELDYDITAGSSLENTEISNGKKKGKTTDSDEITGDKLGGGGASDTAFIQIIPGERPNEEFYW